MSVEGAHANSSGMPDYPALIGEAVDALERAGCDFWACDGPTLEPVNMVTCYRCATLATLRVSIGRPPRAAGEEGQKGAAEAEERRYLARCVGGPL